MTGLSLQDKQRIETAVMTAEARTSVEFAVVIAHASDHYAAFPLLWSAVLALVTGGGIALLLPNASGRMVFAIQATMFVIGGLVFYAKPLRFRLVPASIQHEHASRLARLEFASLVHERTRGGLGVLLFVSMAERHVEILVDRGIGLRVSQAAWQKIIDDFVTEVRAGRAIEGILSAIESCTSVLALYFSAASGRDKDIIPHVTEV